MAIQGNGFAIFAMLLATAGFLFNDTLVKLTSTEVSFGQVIFARGCFCILLLGAICLYRGVFAHWRDLFNRYVLMRAFFEVVSTALYLSALRNLPIANATSILQALPLVVTAGAAIFLGTRVGWRRWTAIAVGFSGVILIVRPGLDGFDVWSLVVLASVLTMTGRDLVTRFAPSHVPSIGISLVTSTSVTIFGAVLAMYEGWEPISNHNLSLLALSAIFLTIGYVFITASVRVGDISIVAPFRYSAVLWAMGLGFLVWGELPDAATSVGTAIVVATGLYTLWRERKLMRMKN